MFGHFSALNTRALILVKNKQKEKKNVYHAGLIFFNNSTLKFKFGLQLNTIYFLCKTDISSNSLICYCPESRFYFILLFYFI